MISLRKLPLLIGMLVCGHAIAAPNVVIEYDANGNPTHTAPVLGAPTTITYDALGRPTSELNGTRTTQRTYDMLGRSRTLQDAAGFTTEYQHQPLDSGAVLLSPDSGNSSNTFDAAGRLATSTDAKGNVATYSYDALSRVTSITYTPPVGQGSPVTHTFGYDAGTYGKGFLTSITSPAGSSSFVFDALGRLVTKTEIIQGHTYITGYAYNGQGKLDSITYPSGRVIQYGYTGSQLTSLTSVVNGNSVPILSNITYFPFGDVSGFTYANGQTYSNTRDLNGRITSYGLAGDLTSLTYDDANNITGLTATGFSATAQFDTHNRLTEYVSPLGTDTYSYDAIDNRTLANGVGYTYTGKQLTQVGSENRTYDANGNTVTKGALQFEYDATNRLVRAVTPAGNADYLVDPTGLRRVKTFDGKTLVFHYNGSGQLIAESDETGKFLREYVYLGSRPVYLAGTKETLASILTLDDDQATFTGQWQTIPAPEAVGGSYRKMPTP